MASSNTDAARTGGARRPLTSPERLPRWFLPVSGELRLGGRYQFEGNAGGTITACEPERRIEATWEFGGEVSWVFVTLEPAPAGGTRLELTHVARLDGFAGQHWAQYGPGATGVGWDLGLMGLALHLGDPAAAMDPRAMEAWSVGDEGKAFVRGTSAAWGEAAIASGDPEDQARAAAEATRAFYSGEAPPQGA